jgi:CrcB protein
MPYDYLLIMAGAVLGANARYLVSLWAARRYGPEFPLGTFLVNVSGSVLLGFIAALAVQWPVGAVLTPFFAIGFCGSYTTFSTLAYETVALARRGSYQAALANIFASMLLGVAGAALGSALAGILASGGMR